MIYPCSCVALLLFCFNVFGFHVSFGMRASLVRFGRLCSSLPLCSSAALLLLFLCSCFCSLSALWADPTAVFFKSSSTALRPDRRPDRSALQKLFDSSPTRPPTRPKCFSIQVSFLFFLCSLVSLLLLFFCSFAALFRLSCLLLHWSSTALQM